MAAVQPPRRAIRYTTLGEVLADAGRLVRAGAVATGNWSLAQILGHLAIAIEGSIDGVPGAFPWYVRFVGRYVVKPRILKHGMKPENVELVKNETEAVRRALAVARKGDLVAIFADRTAKVAAQIDFERQKEQRGG